MDAEQTTQLQPVVPRLRKRQATPPYLSPSWRCASLGIEVNLPLLYCHRPTRYTNIGRGGRCVVNAVDLHSGISEFNLRRTTIILTDFSLIFPSLCQASRLP
jgi:hypothetical protein